MLLRRIASPLVAVLALIAFSVAVMAQGKTPPAHTDIDNFVFFTANPFQVYVTNSGRINAIKSPSSLTHNGNSDYELCTGLGNYRGSQGDFYLPADGVVQTKGPGTLPLSITVKTNDNQWQIKWTYTVNATDFELTVAAAVKRTGYPGYDVYLELGTDFDIPPTTPTQNYFDVSKESAWQRGSDGTFAWALLGMTRKYVRYAYATPYSNIYNPGCTPAQATTEPSDVSSGITYHIGTVTWNATPVVKFQYNRH